MAKVAPRKGRARLQIGGRHHSGRERVQGCPTIQENVLKEIASRHVGEGKGEECEMEM